MLIPFLNNCMFSICRHLFFLKKVQLSKKRIHIGQKQHCRAYKKKKKVGQAHHFSLFPFFSNDTHESNTHTYFCGITSEFRIFTANASSLSHVTLPIIPSSFISLNHFFNNNFIHLYFN
ncbi:hypothetical protein S83_048449 [Arachis hypogaea]